MTIEKCKKFCFDKNYLYAGVQNTNECFCGNDIKPKILKPKTECKLHCTGDSSQICGGPWRMNIYENTGITNFYLKVCIHMTSELCSWM